MAAQTQLELQKDELEGIEGIYSSNYKLLQSSPPYKFQITIIPESIENELKDAYMSITIDFVLPIKYPCQAPIIHNIKRSKYGIQSLKKVYPLTQQTKEYLQLSKYEINKIKNVISNSIDENLDVNDPSGILFTILDDIQTYCNENNQQPNISDSLHSQRDPTTTTTTTRDIENNNIERKEMKEEKKSENNGDAMTTIKPKLLCLHAYKQNPKTFKHRCKNIMRLLNDEFEFFIPCAPIQLTPSQMDPNPYCWYQYPTIKTNNSNISNSSNNNNKSNKNNKIGNNEKNDDNGSNMKDILKCICVEYIHFDKFLLHISKYIIDNGPFNGILSFSQGSTVSQLLLWLASLTDDQFMEYVIEPNRESFTKCGLIGLYNKYGQYFRKNLGNKHCKCVVLMSTHVYPVPKQFENGFYNFVKFGSFGAQTESNQKMSKLAINSLHVWGKTDQWVTNDQSKEATHLFENVKIMQHNGAHVIPDKNKAIAKEIAQFIQNSQKL